MHLTYNYPSQVRIATTAIIKRSWKAFTNFLSSFGESLAKGQQARADFWILHNMTDKNLHDIGISRGEINRVIADGFKNKK